MELTLIRTNLTEKSSIGELFADNHFLAYTLEDVVRPVKVPKTTAIPFGRYRVVLAKSPRFGYVTPILLDVPNFSSIRIHRGNAPDDTEGCILVGRVKGNNIIGESKIAFENDVMPTIEAAIQNGEDVWISIERGPLTPLAPQTEGVDV